MSDLKERLLATRVVGYGRMPDDDPHHERINPDGPKALARIGKLEAALREIEDADTFIDLAAEVNGGVRRVTVRGKSAKIARQALQSGEARGV